MLRNATRRDKAQCAQVAAQKNSAVRGEDHHCGITFAARRAARHLGELLGKEVVAAHHGSLAKEARLRAMTPSTSLRRIFSASCLRDSICLTICAYDLLMISIQTCPPATGLQQAFGVWYSVMRQFQWREHNTRRRSFPAIGI